jgi:hypothetical protein
MTVRNQQTKQRNADCDCRNQQKSPPLPMLKHFHRLPIRSIPAPNFRSQQARGSTLERIRAQAFVVSRSLPTGRHFRTNAFDLVAEEVAASLPYGEGATGRRKRDRAIPNKRNYQSGDKRVTTFVCVAA